MRSDVCHKDDLRSRWWRWWRRNASARVGQVSTIVARNNGDVVALSIVLTIVMRLHSRIPSLVVHGAALSLNNTILGGHEGGPKLTGLVRACRKVVLGLSSASCSAEGRVEWSGVEVLDTHVCVCVVAILIQYVSWILCL